MKPKIYSFGFRQQENEAMKILVDSGDMVTLADYEKAISALRGCLSVMYIQEQRQKEEFHLSAEAFQPMWDKAMADGHSVLASEDTGP